MHLIDDVYIQNSLQKLYGEAFTQLADENKNILVRSFRFEDTISVPAADFNQNALKSVFKDHDKKIKIQTLAQAAKIESIKEDHEKEQE